MIKDMKGNDVAEQPQPAEKKEIPFGKPARVGNFKIWRGRKITGRGNGKMSIDQINISSLDEEWQVKIPATYEMFAAIRGLYAQGNQEARLSTIFGNMMYASIVANGYFHHAINIVATIYANPNLLDENDKQHEMLVNNAKALIKGFLEWRKRYNEQTAANEPTDEDIRNENMAEDVLKEVYSDEDGKTDT